MCFFLTVGVDKRKVATLRNHHQGAEGLCITPSVNPHLASVFPATDIRFDVTLRGCSCFVYQHQAGGPDPRLTALLEEQLRDFGAMRLFIRDCRDSPDMDAPTVEGRTTVTLVDFVRGVFSENTLTTVVRERFHAAPS